MEVTVHIANTDYREAALMFLKITPVLRLYMRKSCRIVYLSWSTSEPPLKMKKGKKTVTVKGTFVTISHTRLGQEQLTWLGNYLTELVRVKTIVS